MSETEQLRMALQVAMEQRNAASNQVIDLTVTLAMVRAELAAANAAKETAKPKKAKVA